MNEHLPLLHEDGSPFSIDELAAASGALDALDFAHRARAQNDNCDAIASCDAERILVVSGPGTGKSTLFKARARYLLSRFPEQRVAIATFVGKLVKDLRDDFATDSELTAAERARIEVSTLHSLARSIVERNHGTHALPLGEHCLVINAYWERMVWLDAVSLEEKPEIEFPWEGILPALYDATDPPDEQWKALRTRHLGLQQFYNALTFSDLILFATQAAIENPELVEDTSFIIDEFQDFNIAEERLIRAVARESAGLFLAGDDDQVLYDDLRRAHASIIRDYYEDRSFAKAMLPYCSRCSFHITKNAAAFLALDPPAEAIAKIFLPLRTEENANPVVIAASTTPTAGVDFIAHFLEVNREAIEERQRKLDSSDAKDPFLLILTTSRDMKFLNAGGARERMMELLAIYMRQPPRLSADYWMVRDFYYGAVRPSQNYNVRKMLAYDDVEQSVVTQLLREALASGRNLADLDRNVVRRALEKAEAVRGVIENDAEPADKVEGLSGMVSLDDPERLAIELDMHPIKGEPDPDDGSSPHQQNDMTGAVDLTTIVGAKGLSADHVIVLGCDQVFLGLFKRTAFFVALTRARETLTLLACMGGGGATRLHDFVCALPEAHTRALYVKTSQVQEIGSVTELQSRLGKTAWAREKAAVDARARKDAE